LPTDLSQIFSLVLPFFIVIAVFYFLIWRPQAAEQKKRKAMLEALKKGDEIVTAGGIHGTIVVVKKDTLIIKIGEKTEIEIDRSGIGGVRG
jgi:preprotein translocase subunit YajC